jgi:hypothetical protein
MAYLWVALSIGVLLLLLFRSTWLRTRMRRNELLALIPGPMALPLLGNTLEINVAHDGRRLFSFLALTSEISLSLLCVEIFTRMNSNWKIWGGPDTGMNRFWLGNQPYVFVYSPQTVEVEFSVALF